MRILIITPYYFPYINPRAHRWTEIAEYWAKEGHEVQVVCSRGRDLPEESASNGVQIHRTGYSAAKEWFFSVFNIKNSRGSVRDAPEAAVSLRGSRLQRLLIWLNERLWRKVYWPDDACIWYFPARRKAIGLLSAAPFDLMISVSLPFTSHLVGLACKRRFPALRWVADTGDPFSLQDLYKLNNFFIYKKLNFNTERKILEMSDRLTVTTEATRQLYGRHFPGSLAKVQVIPPLRSRAGDEKTNERLLDLNDHYIHIGYFGSFFRDVRTPDALLDLLQTLRRAHPELRVMLHFAGEVFEEFLPAFRNCAAADELFRLYGLLPREAAVQLMRRMDFLINVGNQTDYQLPSKSVDYLLSGLPVINLCYVAADPFAQFFAHYPLMINVLVKENRVGEEEREKLCAFVSAQRGRRVAPELIRQFEALYAVEAIAAGYLG